MGDIQHLSEAGLPSSFEYQKRHGHAAVDEVRGQSYCCYFLLV